MKILILIVINERYLKSNYKLNNKTKVRQYIKLNRMITAYITYRIF